MATRRVIIDGVARLVGDCRLSRVRQTLPAVVICGTLSGCVGGADDASQGWSDLPMALRHADSARVVRTPAPRSDAPAPIVDLIMLDARAGALIGRRADGAVIQRTADAGAHWRIVHALRATTLGWIGRDDRSLVAAGADDRGPLLLRSIDRGRRWRAMRPRVSGKRWRHAARFAFSGRGGALAIPAPAVHPVGASARFGLLRSGDHGRSWRAVWLPGGERATSVTFTPDGRTAYATSTGAPGCTSAVLRSDDQGAHWRLLRGACGQHGRLLSVAFTDARHGYAVGGASAGRPTSAGAFVIKTADGGRTWRRVWRRTNFRQEIVSPPDRLAFFDARHGWALAGGRGAPQGSGGFPASALYTSDGGAHWRSTGRHAGQIALTGPASALIADGVIDEQRGGTLALTRDGGRRWADLASLRQIGPVGRLIGSGSWLLIGGVRSSVPADYLSTDGGRRWRTIRLPPVYSDELLAVAPGLIVRGEDRACRLIASRDGGRTYGAVRGPTSGHLVMTNDGRRRVRVCGTQGLAFTDAMHGALLVQDQHEITRIYRTVDGGRSWIRGAALSDRGNARTASLAGGRAATTAVFTSGRALISGDGGRTSRSLPFPADTECDAGAARGRDVWLLCTRLAVFEPGPVATARILRQAAKVVFYSADAGRHWRAHIGKAVGLPEQIVAVAAGRALGAPAEFSPDDASLLAIEDGGAVWRRVWPALPIGPNAPGLPR